MAKAKSEANVKLVAKNRRARFEYVVEETLEVGLVLVGSEVKSIRDGRINLSDGYAAVKGGELWLENVHISPYSHTHYGNHDPDRRRKLLAHRAEIRRLAGKTSEKGYSLIPLRVYFKEGVAKMELAVAKGKKTYDKREAIRKREDERAMERHFRRGSR